MCVGLPLGLKMTQAWSCHQATVTPCATASSQSLQPPDFHAKVPPLNSAITFKAVARRWINGEGRPGSSYK